MRRIWFVLPAVSLTATLALAAASCGEIEKLNLDGGNCSLTGKSVCLDYPDSATDGTTKEAQCAALKTAFGAAGTSYTAGTGNDCSTANRLGSCAISSGTLRYYSGSTWANATAAEASCVGQSGTWTAN